MRVFYDRCRPRQVYSRMKSFALRWILALCFVGANAASSQTPAESFDDLSRQAESLLDSKPAEAVDLYRRALKLQPNWAEGWFNLGGTLYQLDRYAEGTDALRKAVELAPGHGIAWALLGLCEAELDNTDQAIADIRKGEDLGLGGNADFERAARVKAAQVLIRSSAFDEALGQLFPLSKQNEDSPAVVNTMGLCALAIPKKLSDLTPERRAVVEAAGKAAWASVSQKPAEAAAAYKELLEKYPNEPGVHYAYGLYLMETDLAASLEHLHKEIEIDPKNWPALVLAASNHLKQGEPDKSIPLLKQAMKAAPVNYRWLCHAEMGRANLTAENLDGAISEFQAAARLKPGIAQVHFMLAQAYRLSGRKEEAQKETAEFQRLKVLQDPLGVPALQSVYSGGKY